MKTWQFGTIAGLLVLIGVAFFQQVQINKLRSTVAQVVADAEDAEGAPATKTKATKKNTWGDKALLLRIASLEKMTTRLTAMVATGAGRKVAVASGANASDVASLREDVDAVLTGNAVDTKAGQKKLTELAEKISEKQREERGKRREMIEQQMIGSRVQAFSAETNIEGQQLETVLAISQEARQKTNLIQEKVESGELEYEAAVDQQNQLKSEINKRLSEHLNEKQISAYIKHVVKPGDKEALLR